MSFEPVLRILLCCFAAWACFYAPGQALLGRSPLGVPAIFARVLASAIVTTLIGTALAAAGGFSLASLLGCVAAVVATGLVFHRSSRGDAGDRSGRGSLAGVLVFVLALAAYWPPYPTFLGMSDSTAYVSSGIWLAHHGTLALNDDLGPRLPLKARQQLFDSMSQVFGHSGPPYRRMPGGIMLESLEATRAWPCFFPVPSVWAAIFVVAGAPGGKTAEEAATGFAPVFLALAAWAFWLIACEWLGPRYGLLATILLAASAPWYYAARLPLAEPVAAFFALGGLAVVTLTSGRMTRSDALLAGSALGAAIFVRAETILFLGVALALMTILSPAAERRRAALPIAFFVSLAAVASLMLIEIAVLPGSYVDPLLDQPKNAWIDYLWHVGTPSALLIAVAAATGVAVFVLSVTRFGWLATLCWGFVLGVAVGQASASRFLYQRTPMWLSFYIGWPGLALAFAGAFVAWRDRSRLPAAPLVLGVAAAAVLILFYNPHVYPAIPWGGRRFVPLLLPMLVLLSTYAVRRAADRSRLVSLACGAALVIGVALGGRPIWGVNFVEGAWDQLEAVAAAIPGNGLLLIDRDTSATMLGPALWLIKDRNSLPIPALASAAGRYYAPPIVWYFGLKEPIYYLTRGTTNQIPVPKVRMTLVTTVATNLRLLEQTHDRRPEKTERYLLPLSVYRLEPIIDPRGVIVRNTSKALSTSTMPVDNEPRFDDGKPASGENPPSKKPKTRRRPAKTGSGQPSEN